MMCIQILSMKTSLYKNIYNILCEKSKKEERNKLIPGLSIWKF